MDRNRIKWPSEYYSDNELRNLAILTGIRYETLANPAHYNPEAIERLKIAEQIDQLLTKYAAYMSENYQATQSNFEIRKF